MEVCNLEKFNYLVGCLASNISAANLRYSNIYGVPRGGVYVALALSALLKKPLVSAKDVTKNTLVVDDIVDSGETRERYPNNDFACLYKKNELVLHPFIFAQMAHGWVEFFWEKESKENPAEDAVTRMIQVIGENPNRPGLKDTPKRVTKMWKETFKGYNPACLPKVTVFANDGSDGVKYDTMLRDEGYFFSYCEHHMLPFFGEYSFGYIPSDLLIGASKIARVVDYFSARLQIAERLVFDIVNHLDEKINSKGMILVMSARHLCKEMRGVKKFNSPFEVISATGYFSENKDGCKDEFIARMKK